MNVYIIHIEFTLFQHFSKSTSLARLDTVETDTGGSDSESLSLMNFNCEYNKSFELIFEFKISFHYT